MSRRGQIVLLLILLAAAAVGYVFVCHDYALYDMTVVKITDV